jgi:probable rRNA maturation factor
MTNRTAMTTPSPSAVVHPAIGLPGDDQPESEPPSRAAAGGLLDIDIVLDDADWSAFGDVEAAVADVARALGEFEPLKLSPSTAVLALSGDAEVAALNGQYRGKASATNVLSFPALPTSPGDGRRQLGDIIIARETVLAEAAAEGIAPVHHLQHLAVHGVLHLLGYDHIDDSEAAVMEAFETRILAGLGVPDPYAGTGPTAGEA